MSGPAARRVTRRRALGSVGAVVAQAVGAAKSARADGVGGGAPRAQNVKLHVK
jgi:hypothetical protein